MMQTVGRICDLTLSRSIVKLVGLSLYFSLAISLGLMGKDIFYLG
jgi:hypothetical protein